MNNTLGIIVNQMRIVAFLHIVVRKINVSQEVYVIMDKSRLMIFVITHLNVSLVVAVILLENVRIS
jgi:hypothetical protein